MQEGVAANVSRMTELAHRDPLTGLPTRVLFADRLEQAIATGSRAGAPVAVMILNLDHFAHVNETLGHPIGDMMLREVAARLRSVVRRANDSVARIGGDEFAILMAGSRTTDARRVAEAVAHALEVKMTLKGHVVDFFSLFDPHGQAFPIFNVADMALTSGVILAVLLEVLGRHRDGTRLRSRDAKNG